MQQDNSQAILEDLWNNLKAVSVTYSKIKMDELSQEQRQELHEFAKLTSAFAHLLLATEEMRQDGEPPSPSSLADLQLLIHSHCDDGIVSLRQVIRYQDNQPVEPVRITL